MANPFTTTAIEDLLRRAAFTFAGTALPLALAAWGGGQFDGKAFTVAAWMGLAAALAVVWRAVEVIAGSGFLDGSTLGVALRTFIQTIAAAVISQLSSSTPFDLGSWKQIVLMGLAPLATYFLLVGRGNADAAAAKGRLRAG